MRVILTSLLLFFFSFPMAAEEIAPGLARQCDDTFEASERAESCSLLAGYFNADDDRMREGIGYIMFAGTFAQKHEKNFALLLLARILKIAKPPRNDTMPIALALAYNYNYSVGDPDVQRNLLQDLAAHYDLYRDINAWQKREMPYAALENLPIIAQTYWASRDRSGYETINMSEYKKRLVSVAALKRLHLALSQAEEIRGSSVFEWADHLNRWYRARRLPADKLTKEIDTYAAGPILSFQEKEGRFPSANCVADATNLSALYQAIGLAPLTFYQNFRSTGTDRGINHEWPAVFDPATDRWISAQRGNPWPTFTERDVPVDFEIFRPVWHHALVQEGREDYRKLPESERSKAAHIGGRFRVNSYGERSTNGAMRDFVLRGMSKEDMLFVWKSPVWRRSADGWLTGRKPD